MAWIWGSLSYAAAAANNTNPPVQTHNIVITSIEQSLQLDGSTAQSRRARHFYPRSHMPGDIVVNGICRNQEDYQRLAYFVRHNQWAILGTPNGNFQRQQQANVNRLLLLDVPTENNQWRGYVKTFGMTKKGVHDPAPTYQFNFVVIFDNLAENFGISSRIRALHSQGGQPGNGGPPVNPPPPPPPPTPQPSATTWITSAGDTLHSISHKVYGVFYLWINLYRENKDAFPQLVKDALAPIEPGLALSTPPRKELPA